jgi:hypothetical protein
MQQYNNGPIIFIFTWSTVFPEKLAVPQLVKIFPPFYENQRFYYCVDNLPQRGSTRSQLNLDHTLISRFIYIHFKLPTPRCTKRSDSCSLFSYIPIRISHLLIHSFIHQWLYSFSLGPGLFFSSVIFFTKKVGLLGRGMSPSQGRYLQTEQHKQNKRTHRHP